MVRYINLYDPSLRQQRDWWSLQSLVVLALVLLLVLMAWFALLRGRGQDMQSEAAQLTQTLDEQRQTVERLRLQRGADQHRLQLDIAAAQALLERRSAALQRLQEEQSFMDVSHAQVMQALSRQHGRGLWLTGFRLERGLTAVELRGRALEAGLLPAYLKRLSAEPVFAGKRFHALEMGRPAPGKDAADPAPYLDFVLSSRPTPAEAKAPATQGGGA